MPFTLRPAFLLVAATLLATACSGGSSTPTVGAPTSATAAGGSLAPPTSAAAASPSASPAASPGALTVGVVTSQLQFDRTALSARAGQPITVTFNNTDTALPHSFVIDQPAVSIPSNAVVGFTNQTGSAQVTFPVGTYQFYCAVPGHKEAGMVGTLQITS
jgi:uncharacterized cupredoxin-like copper-binding protein